YHTTYNYYHSLHDALPILQKLEDISKIRSYYLTNTKAELLYHGKELTCSELRNMVNDSSIGTLMSVESEDDYSNNANSNDDSIQDRKSTRLNSSHQIISYA